TRFSRDWSSDVCSSDLGHLETLIQAARDRRPCAILYVKPGAADAEARVIHPFAMVASEGAWYAVGHCCVRDAVRAFRVDRVLHEIGRAACRERGREDDE